MLKDLIRISHYAGRRFDLSQANGGNSSVKIDDYLYIKSSGYYLSDLNETTGVAKVRFKLLQQLLEHPDHINAKQIKNTVQYNLVSGNRPSIEVGMHALLGTFVLHTHPLAINAVTCHQEWQQLLEQLFPEALCIPYATPGFALAIKVANKLKATKTAPRKTLILFLQNHGLVISADNADTAISETERVTTKIEQHFKLDFEKYKTAAKICTFIEKISPQHNFCHCSDDQDLQNILTTDKALFFQNYCLPIAYVYNTLALEIMDLEDAAPIRAYLQLHQKTPQVIIYRNRIYLLTANIHQAPELESVVKEHLLIHKIVKNKARLLTTEEIKQLQEDMSS